MRLLCSYRTAFVALLFSGSLNRLHAAPSQSHLVGGVRLHDGPRQQVAGSPRSTSAQRLGSGEVSTSASRKSAQVTSRSGEAAMRSTVRREELRAPPAWSSMQKHLCKAFDTKGGGCVQRPSLSQACAKPENLRILET